MDSRIREAERLFDDLADRLSDVGELHVCREERSRRRRTRVDITPAMVSAAVGFELRLAT
jgi:hypothetical protein